MHTPRRTKRVGAGLMSVLLALTLISAACGGKATGTDDASTQTSNNPQPNAVGALRTGPADSEVSAGGKITYGIDGEPEGLDPTRYAFSQAGHAVASAVYDSLADLDQNGQAVPYLAKSFEPNGDFTEWTIEIPTGVMFHDGTPLDADALVTIYNAYKDSGITGPPMKSVVASFEKRDATHMIVKMSQPTRAFPVFLTTQVGFVPAPAMLTNTDLAKKPVGTGPFTFEAHEDGKFWRFKKNATYRQAGLPHLDAIEFQPVVDNKIRVQKLISGDLDVIQTLDGSAINELRQNADVKRVENLHGDKAHLVLNTTKPPFDNLAARQAVAYATDSAKYRKEIFADVATPVNSPYSPGQPGFTRDNGFPTYDLAKAKEKVAAYEAETGKKLEFTFLAVNDAMNASVAQTFAAGFEAAGMKVNITQMPQINLLANVATGNYELSQFRLFAQPNPDADVFYYSSKAIAPGISVNFPRYASPEIDAAINDALATDDPGKRAKAYERVSKVMAENVPYVWLGQVVWMVAASKRVNGISGALNGTVATSGPKMWIQQLSVSKT